MAGLGLAMAADRANAAEQHDRGLAVAWQRQSDLSPSDRAYLIAFAGPRYPEPSPAAEAFARVGKCVVRVAPDRVDGWHELGESFYYDGDLLGMRDAPARAADAFRHALRLDSVVRSVAPHADAAARAAVRYRRVETSRDFRSERCDTTDALRVFVKWRTALRARDERR